VITDDQRARNVCRRIGLKVLDALGLVEFAKKHGVVIKEEALSFARENP